jgi:hypothetical protein
VSDTRCAPPRRDLAGSDARDADANFRPERHLQVGLLLRRAARVVAGCRRLLCGRIQNVITVQRIQNPAADVRHKTVWENSECNQTNRVCYFTHLPLITGIIKTFALAQHGGPPRNVVELQSECVPNEREPAPKSAVPAYEHADDQGNDVTSA